ncbi:Pkinase-domain-containing protein [Microstroma glucosiphilum]|uniref:Pkinase-domain-containing protein n=1 Tax=Pseudomicrostroma glucosiphilum TaxID=1684307 RepID=A0A316U8V8_9BASI|nr:Pkinase-domain-containing protein [Pseudomicrostroma glucosiphilum]PWN21690.1 Pkinase-domain-containing protein [Pseudomicrostroma glucosiphilum]
MASPLTSRPSTPKSAGVHVTAAGPIPSGRYERGSSSASFTSLHSPSRTAISLEDVKKWNDGDVAAWLTSHRLAHHALTFAQNDITGQVLLDVDQNALREMGIVAVGDRIRVFAAIKALKKRCIESGQVNRNVMLQAQERAEAAHRAQLQAEQAQEDENLMDFLSRPHQVTFINEDPNGQIEYLNGSVGERETGGYLPALGALDGAAAAAAAGPRTQDERRTRPSSRPPPLRLSGSATSNVPTTPTYPSPALHGSFNINGSQGNGTYGQAIPGFAQNRGLGTVGSGSGSSVERPSSANRSPLPPSMRNGEGRLDNSSAATASGHPTHRKTNSALPSFMMTQATPVEAGIVPRQFGSLGAPAGRPSNGSPYNTMGGLEHQQGNVARLAHHFGSPSAQSPTGGSFGSRQIRPATADSAYDNHARGGWNPYGGDTSLNAGGPGAASPLTPITEGLTQSPTTPTSSAGNARQGGTVRGGSSSALRFNSYAASTASSSNAASSTLRGPNSTFSSHDNAHHPSLEDLRRKTIKFIGDDGTTRIVNVSDCTDAHEVLARVLKKFGKSASANTYPAPQGHSPAVEGSFDAGAAGEAEKYVIVAVSLEGQTRELKPEELLAICHAPQTHDPLRERGLVLRKIPNGASSTDSTSRRIARSGRNKLEAFFGERMHDTLHHGHGHGHSSSSSAQSGAHTGSGTGTPADGDSSSTTVGHVTTAGKKMNRASTVSIMSGLGAGALMAMVAAGHNVGNAQSSPASSSARGGARSPPEANSDRESRTDTAHKAGSGSLIALPRKTRNFMGQRPPSELISNHLADFFPATEKRVLERTARKSIYGRASTSLRSSKRDSTWSFRGGATGEDSIPPPLPTKTGNESDFRRAAKDAMSMSSPPVTNAPTLPAVVSGASLDDWSKSIQQSVGGASNSRLEIPDGTQYASRPRNVRQASDHSSARVSLESTRSRKSYGSHLRTARGPSSMSGGFTSSSASNRPASTLNDRSDAASMLTVDEITQEVESRRLSQTFNDAAGDVEDDTCVVDGDGVPIPIRPAARRGGSGSRPKSKRDTNSRSAGDRTSVITLEGDSLRERRGSGDEDGDAASAFSGSRAQGSSPAPASVVLERPSPAMDMQRPPLSSSLEEEDEDEEGEEQDDDEDSERGSLSESSLLDDYGEADEDDSVSDEDEDEEKDDEEDQKAPSVKEDIAGDTSADGVARSRSVGGAGSASRASSGQAAMTKKTSSSGASKQPIKWIKGALIGAGSFGSVYLGMNAKNGLLMAVKQVELPSGQSQNDQKKKRMLDALEGEIELLKTIQHENIVQYLDSYADGTHLNIFLEYVPGGSVVALLRNYGAFEEPLVRNFVRQILHGLSFLHGQDIVHRDIKGANILVDNKSCIKISDFGISKKVESDLLTNARAHRPSLQGSVFWMAPEVVKQTSYSRKADIWSLGCLVVEMMSGTHPWPNLNQMQALFKIGSCAKPSLPEEISAEAVDFLEKTFEIDHEKRPTADELLRHAFITEEVLGATTGDEMDGEAGRAQATSEEGEGQGQGEEEAPKVAPVAAPPLAAGQVDGTAPATKRRERQASHVSEA